MKTILFLFAFLPAALLKAEVKIASVFTHHMVLQRNAPVPVWGWAAKGEKITVQFNNQTKQTTADKTGKWMLYLDNEQAGGPFTLKVKGKSNTVELNDILVGEVWICSGQSNMEWPLSATINAEQEIASANNNLIRHIKVERTISVEPQNDFKSNGWEVCSPATAPNFTAVGYYFAKQLQKELNVPVGLINTSWGGTIVETWISKSGLQTHPEFAAIANQLPTSREQFEKEQILNIKKNVSSFQYTDDKEVKTGWELPAYDDFRWSNLVAPKSWEEQGLAGLDGTVWYRKTVTLTAEQTGKDVVLWLGKIDDCDVTFVNGVKVDETCVYDKVRRYVIPAKLLKEGKNVIAVKVLDTGGGGGFWGDANDMKLETTTGTVSLAGEWKARVDVHSSVTSVNPNSMPALLYNAMIHPLIPFAFKGVIWYQGESNAERAQQYAASFPLMIQDWRNKFKQGDFPFYFVQLASFNANNQNQTTGSAWAELRESQRNTLQLAKTGMAVTTDIGDAKDIHPRNKLDVGKRLALLALKNDYGKNIVAGGPMYKSMTVRNKQIVIEFENTGKGLVATGNKYGYLQGFMIAGANQKFYWAKAWVRNNKVIVWSDEVDEPVAVRYAWTDDTSEANLFNAEGLPASPFRTDNWKLMTDGIKYTFGK
ncbi:MAG: sialate O-acetylesterase [Lacibacter sp.]